MTLEKHREKEAITIRSKITWPTTTQLPVRGQEAKAIAPLNMWVYTCVYASACMCVCVCVHSMEFKS